MLRLAVLLGILLSLLPATTNAQAPASCSDFDAWVWAQTVYEENPAIFASLDDDGDGVACPTLTIHGFAPVLWADAIPASAEAAQVVRIIDGDTFEVTVNGQPDTVRMYHIDAPETSFEQQCGGLGATDFLAYVLQWAPNNTVYLEYDQTERDRFDRRLAYVWYQIGSDVYLVNEAMVRNGWAESDTFRPDDKYKAELDAAEQFSVEKVLGVRLECGRFGRPIGSGPSDQQVRQAMFSQPNQGQFAAWLAPTPAPQPTQAPQPPQQQAPAPTAVPQPPQNNCDPNYTPCVPNVSYDLDCKDIGFRVRVIGYDRHGFDRDNDGIGCESY